ncbi:MAG: GLUG motif-containing protein [Sedimentisphaerales bacterium]
MCKARYKMLVIIGLVYCSFSSVFAYSGDGDGSADKPYQIATVDDWNYLTNPDHSSDWGSFFILKADLTLGYASSQKSIGNTDTAFTGDFDGDGHIISKAYVESYPLSNCVGIFGVVGSVDGTKGCIHNLGLKDVNAYGKDCVGILAAVNRGTIEKCRVVGKTPPETFGNTRFGGLVGWNTDTGIIRKCYSLANVKPNGLDRSQAGGLVGANQGTITDCYAKGSVRGLDCIGGLAGENSGSIINSFATGLVTLEAGGSGGGLVGCEDGTVMQACFWDTYTSGTNDGVGNRDPDPPGVMGKTTIGMKTKSTFTDAGWDFTNTWAICEITNYPRLIWQIPAADFVCPDGVNYKDHAFFGWHWHYNCSEQECEGTDLNQDGVVDFKDFRIFVQEWLEGI